MKRFLSLIFLCSMLALSVKGQVINNPLTANITAQSTDCSVANSCAWQLVTLSAGQSVVTLAGSFSGTFLVEQTNNGTTWTTAATLSSTGTTTYNQNGFTAIRVRCSAYTSGTAAVTISTGTGGSSGGGSTVAPGLGSPALPATANLIAENLFLDGSGTVMSDSSGAGNTCTLAAAGAAPTVNSVASGGGLTFNSANSQFCSWPAAMNSAQTFVIAMSFQQGAGTLAPSETNNFYFVPILAGSGVLANSIDWLLYQNYNTDTQAPGSQGAMHFRTQSTTNSTFRSASACNFLGTGVVAFSMAAPDAFYINGQPCVLRQTGSSVGQQTVGVLQLGGSSTAQPQGQPAGFFNGTMYCVAAWNVALTPPQVAQASQALKSSCLDQRGITAFLGGSISITPALQDSHDSNVLEGDSLFAGINIPAQGINGALVSTSDTAIAGTGTWGILSRFMLDDAVLYRPGANRNTFIEWAGTNDTAQTPINITGNLCATARLAEQVGFNTYFATMISRTVQEVQRDNLNPLIRQYIPSCSRTYTGILDLGANTHLGCDGCNTNGTYFNGDFIHTTTFTDKNIVGPYYVFAFNRANGNKVGAASYNTYTGTGLGIPTLLQTVDCSSLSGLSVTCTLPWNTTAGSLITVNTNCISCASSAINTPTDSQGLTYTSITVQNAYTGSALMRAAFAPNSGAAAETVTQTLTGGAPTNIFITIQEWGGVLTAAPLDVSSAIVTGTSASPLTAAVTTTLSGDLLYGYGATFATNATPAFTPYGTYWQPTSPLTLADDAIPVSAMSRVTGAAGNYTTGAGVQLATLAWGVGTAAFKATTATSTFQLQAQDIYAECLPNGANGVVLILPDGAAMTGGTVTIKNAQTAGAATCVVNAPTPYAMGVQQTIDGATSVTIANKATAVFKSKYSFTGTAGSSLVPVITWVVLQNN